MMQSLQQPQLPHVAHWIATRIGADDQVESNASADTCEYVHRHTSPFTALHSSNHRVVDPDRYTDKLLTQARRDSCAPDLTPDVGNQTPRSASASIRRALSGGHGRRSWPRPIYWQSTAAIQS